MESTVRLSRPTDINVLTDLDAKTYPYPMHKDEWQKLISAQSKKGEARMVVLESGAGSHGFAMWRINPMEPEVCNLIKLGVAPNARRRGLGKHLMATVLKHSAREQVDAVQCIIPEIHCSPGDPDDVSQFLDACGFKATGQIKYDFATMYGDSVDGFVFERKLC